MKKSTASIVVHLLDNKVDGLSIESDMPFPPEFDQEDICVTILNMIMDVIFTHDSLKEKLLSIVLQNIENESPEEFQKTIDLIKKMVKERKDKTALVKIPFLIDSNKKNIC